MEMNQGDGHLLLTAPGPTVVSAALVPDPERAAAERAGTEALRANQRLQLLLDRERERVKLLEQQGGAVIEALPHGDLDAPRLRGE
jgi:hypothetical protein